MEQLERKQSSVIRFHSFSLLHPHPFLVSVTPNITSVLTSASESTVYFSVRIRSLLQRLLPIISIVVHQKYNHHLLYNHRRTNVKPVSRIYRNPKKLYRRQQVVIDAKKVVKCELIKKYRNIKKNKLKYVVP